MKSSVNGALPYFINNKFEKKEIDYKISELIGNSTLIVCKFIDMNFRYGLINSNNELKVPLIYDDYSYKIGDNFIEFIEYPILKMDFSVVSKMDTLDEKNGRTDLKNHLYRYRPESTIQSYEYLGANLIKRKNENDNTTYLFKSNNNFKYETLLKRIFNFPEKREIRFDKINISITIPELLDLMKAVDKGNEKKVDELFEQYYNHRVYLQKEQEEKVKKQNEFCYIATMVYEDYDHPNVILLRKFRDNYLDKFHLGRKFIKIYYKISPSLVNYAKNNFFLKNLFKFIVDKIVFFVRNFT